MQDNYMYLDDIDIIQDVVEFNLKHHAPTTL